MAKRARQTWFLKAWRKHRGWTQQQLADAIGSTTGRISELETGSERYNQDVLETLAHALSTPEELVTPADLTGRHPDEPGFPSRYWNKLPESDRQMLRRVMESRIHEFEAERRPKKDEAKPRAAKKKRAADKD